MKYSKQRSLVLEIVKGSKDHPTADMIYAMASQEMPGIGIATVYRNLNALEQIGEIRRIPGHTGIDRFDGNTEKHYHIKCVGCGNLVDVYPKDEEALAEACALLKKAFGVDGMDVELGDHVFEFLCNKCKGNTAG